MRRRAGRYNPRVASVRYLIALSLAACIVAMVFGLPWILRSFIQPPVGASEIELTPWQMRVVEVSDLAHRLRWLIAPLVITACFGIAWLSGKPKQRSAGRESR